METPKHHIEPAAGRLGVLTVGLGAVASTFVAGVELIRRGLAEPIGYVRSQEPGTPDHTDSLHAHNSARLTLGIIFVARYR